MPCEDLLPPLGVEPPRFAPLEDPLRPPRPPPAAPRPPPRPPLPPPAPRVFFVLVMMSSRLMSILSAIFVLDICPFLSRIVPVVPQPSVSQLSLPPFSSFLSP